MPVKVDFDRFRFEKAHYSGPSDDVVGTRVADAASRFVTKGNEVVRELQRVGWDVPFADVKIRHYGNGKNVIRVCDSVSFDVDTPKGSQRAKISFSLKSGQRGGWNLTGTTSGMEIGEEKISLWSDGQGDWRKNDLLSKHAAHMEALLERLHALPSKPGHDVLHAEGDLNLRRICETEPKPVHEHMPEKLYVWIKANELYYAYNDTGSNLEEDYALEKQVVVPGHSFRMVTTMGRTEYDVPREAYFTANYASAVNEPVKQGLEFGAEYEGLPVEITLKDLSDIYVYDTADYLRGREEASRHADETGEKDWKPGEFEAIKMRAISTLVPASEYRGGYEQPVFMIARQLQKDEARPMNGPLHARIVDGGAEAVMTDEVTGEEILLHETHPDSLYSPVGHMKRSVEAVRKTARITGAPVRIDPGIEEAIKEHRARLREEYKDDATMQLLI